MGGTLYGVPAAVYPSKKRRKEEERNKFDTLTDKMFSQTCNKQFTVHKTPPKH